VVLDTHVLLWWASDRRRLSRPARGAIEAAAHLVVSAVSVWEVATLHRQGRIGLDRPLDRWVQHLAATDRVAIEPVTAEIAAAAGSIETLHGDPCDRLIVATALAAACPLLSKDGQINGWAKQTGLVRCIW
jgi:PIN domain nuclease of toxin-antitoxin system